MAAFSMHRLKVLQKPYWNRIKAEIQPEFACLTGQYRRRSEIIDSIDLHFGNRLDNSILTKT
jgi:hypothetical protein